jgi:membrane peptidoglycan carboxypeptidase
VQNPWSRAGVLSGTAARLIVMTLVAALLAAGITLPFIGITGIAVRDAAATFSGLPAGDLGQVPERSTLYDSNGNVIAYWYPGDIYRVPVSYGQIAPVMRDAIVAIEDDLFYKQGALDPRGTLRALFSNSSGGQLQGASTLAQQYVKNVRVLQAGRNAEAVRQAAYPTFQRKIQQLREAAAVEHEMTQKQLLANYLNVAYFSNSAYGIQVAAGVYFSKTARQLNLPEAALLAGMVQSPTAYNPVSNPAAALARRTEVLTRMAQLHYITKAQATAAEHTKLDLKTSVAPLETGCTSPSAAESGFFCNYVQNVLEVDYPSIWKQVNTTGGLRIYTTLNMQDQLAADHGVDYVMPHYSYAFNPHRNADAEVLIQPGTGAVRAIAIDRKFGNGPGEDDIDFAVNSTYGGSTDGVQTGSSSKIFTLITALKDGYPFGHSIKIVSPSVVGPYYNCHHQYAGTFNVTNSEGPSGKGGETWQLYSASVASINVYFAHLEQQVGLCQTVQTAVEMGMTRADGTQLLKPDKALGVNGLSADNVTSFTLGSVGVSPMSMAAAYASVAARGWYCPPNALTKIETSRGKLLPLKPHGCHRDMSRAVADAANYILQGVLNNPLGTAYGHGIGRPAAGKTGTSNSGYYAAFAGYTPTLAGYVDVFNPIGPTTAAGEMLGEGSCYRDVGDDFPSCPGQMYGDNAPRATWEYTFLRAQLGYPVPFVSPPGYFFAQGAGDSPVIVQPKPKKGKGSPPPGSPPGSPPPTGPHHH